MTQDGRRISVAQDAGVIRDVLVQRPLPVSGFGSPVADAAASRQSAARAAHQHARLVQELERAGVAVRHFDAQLGTALQFADARDWILERRVGEIEPDRRRASELRDWLSEQTGEALASFLIGGIPVAALPRRLGRMANGPDGGNSWFLPPLPELAYPRGKIRFIDGGVVISQPAPEASRAEAITVSAVLNFAPFFDEAHFEFWLTSDGADRSCPPIDGRDIAMPTEAVYVGAITRRTSAQALSLLASSLFRQRKADRMYWIDLTGTDCQCLDDCFLPLSRDCVLADTGILTAVDTFIVGAEQGGAVRTVRSCSGPLIAELSRSTAVSVCVIDTCKHDDPVQRALAALAPIVLSPGRILAFQAHEAAFPLLEQQGIEIASAIDGSALSVCGAGPRDLVTVLHSEAV